MKFRTAQIKALHGTLLEFGEAIHKNRAAMDRDLLAALERLRVELPPYLITLLEGQYNRLSELNSLIDDIEKQIISVARQSETCKRLMEIPGVGPLTRQLIHEDDALPAIRGGAGHTSWRMCIVGVHHHRRPGRQGQRQHTQYQ